MPRFKDYYKWLNESGKFDVLMLGQHMYESSDGSYSFSLESKADEAYGFGKAIVEGLCTGCFHILAHPDRIFRGQKMWNDDMKRLSLDIIDVAIERGIPLEKNLSSMQVKFQYWQEFWAMVPDIAKTILGLDAHSVKELERILSC